MIAQYLKWETLRVSHGVSWWLIQVELTLLRR